MKKVTINTILATLADDITMKWKIDDDGNLRATQSKNGYCYCPLTAYVKLEHGLDVREEDVIDFCSTYINMHGDDADIMIEVSDQADFGDIIENIQFNDDKKTNAEIRNKRKLRERLLTVTRTGGINGQV